METKLAVSKFTDLINKSSKIAFFHHVNPDGDTVASSYGLMKAISENYHEKEVCIVGDFQDISKRFSHLSIAKKFFVNDLQGNDWTTIVGDTSTKKRIYKYEEFCKGKIKACFDHHTDKVDFSLDLLWQDETFPASSIQAWNIAQVLCPQFESKTALIFLHGIITDTGWFAFSLNDQRPFQASVDILKFVKKNNIDHMYHAMARRSLHSLRIEQWVLNNFKIKNNFAYCIFLAEDLEKLKLEPQNCFFVNRIGNIEKCNLWAFFVEDVKENQFRISLRSNGRQVNLFAAKYGGGGHKRASGIRILRNLELVNQIIAELAAYSTE